MDNEDLKLLYGDDVPQEALKPSEDHSEPPAYDRFQPEPPRRERYKSPDFIKVAMLCIIVALASFLLMSQMKGCSLPDDDVIVNPLDIEGLHVLFILDTDSTELTDEQAAMAGSAKWNSWADDHDVELRRYDVKDSTAQLEGIWQKMYDAADGKLSMVTANSKSIRVQPIPEGVEETMAELENRK